ncbi:MAG: hypothetical protein K1X55_13670 [Chitinophagales bacterium]|nr:hypothetical protein [Chitinophagales bacterium]
MGLFDIFRNKKQRQSEEVQQTFDGPTIFYHEDDFRQVEIVPSDNLLSLKTESEKVDTFAKEHFDGSGFTDIYVRNDENKTKLNQRRIDPSDLEKILSSLGFDRIPNVLTGYGQSYREQHKNCVAFGKDYCAVYYDFQDNVVEHIWFTNHWSMDRERLAKSLHELGQQWNLLLQDWNLTITVDLMDKSLIDQYLNTYDEE